MVPTPNGNTDVHGNFAQHANGEQKAQHLAVVSELFKGSANKTRMIVAIVRSPGSKKFSTMKEIVSPSTATGTGAAEHVWPRSRARAL